ncbi:hypothetical protein CYMTET_28331 [Cymbomonas tetramitiformis]|uniref:Uncharacterized protein n=1 Tax=Cymbomonas tetramitiformis TaxID=36881 RepID=A0AAE0KW04_9CHLO|nr:hypothetical protein CYMTET_28331 [Cymbomonas tetramitiformis]
MESWSVHGRCKQPGIQEGNICASEVQILYNGVGVYSAEKEALVGTQTENIEWPYMIVRAVLRAGRKAKLGAEGEADKASLRQSRVVETPSGSVQVERTEDLEVSDPGQVAHRLFPLSVRIRTQPQAGCDLCGKVAHLYGDNQAVLVAMLAHVTSHDPALMRRRMRCLWTLLNLNDIELQASGGTHCEGVDLLAYDLCGENNWINPLGGLLDEVAHKLREEGAGGTVVAPYWPD